MYENKDVDHKLIISIQLSLHPHVSGVAIHISDKKIST